MHANLILFYMLLNFDDEKTKYTNISVSFRLCPFFLLFLFYAVQRYQRVLTVI